MAPSKSATYPHEVQEELRQMLRDLPEPTPDDVTKKTMIRSLAPEIQQLQQRGYSLKAIAEAISKRGVPISPLVLKAYLAPESKPKKSKRKPPRSSTNPNVSAGTETTKPSSATAAMMPASEALPQTAEVTTVDAGDDDWVEETGTAQPIAASPAAASTPKAPASQASRSTINRKST